MRATASNTMFSRVYVRARAPVSYDQRVDKYAIYVKLLGTVQQKICAQILLVLFALTQFKSNSVLMLYVVWVHWCWRHCSFRFTAMWALKTGTLYCTDEGTNSETAVCSLIKISLFCFMKTPSKMPVLLILVHIYIVFHLQNNKHVCQC